MTIDTSGQDSYIDDLLYLDFPGTNFGSWSGAAFTAASVTYTFQLLPYDQSIVAEEEPGIIPSITSLRIITK